MEMLEQVKRAARTAVEAHWETELVHDGEQAGGQQGRIAATALDAAVQAAMAAGLPLLSIMKARGDGELEAAMVGASTIIPLDGRP